MKLHNIAVFIYLVIVGVSLCINSHRIRSLENNINATTRFSSDADAHNSASDSDWILSNQDTSVIISDGKTRMLISTFYYKK